MLPKLFWSTVRKNCSSDREKILKFEVEGQDFSKFLRSLEKLIQTAKGPTHAGAQTKWPKASWNIIQNQWKKNILS